MAMPVSQAVLMLMRVIGLSGMVVEMQDDDLQSISPPVTGRRHALNKVASPLRQQTSPYLEKIKQVLQVS